VLSSQPVRLARRVAAARSFHKRLRFVDIVQDLEPSAKSTSGEHVQVVFREGHANVRINPGDQLDALGTYLTTKILPSRRKARGAAGEKKKK
jgi:hypothetical protein